MNPIGEKKSISTLEVIEGIGGSGLLWRRLGDGFEVGAVALQNGCHKAQEGFLDLHLQGRLLLLPGEVSLNRRHVHRWALLGLLTHWHLSGGRPKNICKSSKKLSFCCAWHQLQFLPVASWGCRLFNELMRLLQGFLGRFFQVLCLFSSDLQQNDSC